MPIYEFYSPRTHKIYSFYARNLSLSGVTPRCPENPDYPMERMISSFAVTGGGKEEKLGSPDAVSPGEEARISQAMAQLEHAYGGMDKTNPNPRQMGRMLKMMSEMMGEKLPRPMVEMIRRMEAGEDLEKLEADYDEELLSDDLLEEDGGEESESSPGLRRPRRAVRRDPTLYEMADYVERT